jgi:putative transcriptional regulator
MSLPSSLAKLGFLMLLAAVGNAQIGPYELLTQRAAVAASASEPRLADASFSVAEVGPADRQVFPSTFLPVQSKNPDQVGLGKLLVASRNLGDPNFMKTVILVVQYDAGGVVGLVLNRRTDLPVSQVIEGIKGAKDRSDPVYAGGPVDPQVILGVFKSPTKVRHDGAKQVFDQVYQVSTKAQLEQIFSDRTPASAVHLYLGYAGWTVEQLKMEMKVGAWFVFPADAETVFNADPDSLWEQMIRKTETQFARNERVELE